MHILDTNIVSYFMRGDPKVVPRLRLLSPSEVAVPAVVAYELRYGLLRLPSPSSGSRLKDLASLLTMFRILPFDAACADEAASIRVVLERAGTPIGTLDTLIAATALRHRAILVTRNIREFSRVDGLSVENWHDD